MCVCFVVAEERSLKNAGDVTRHSREPRAHIHTEGAACSVRRAEIAVPVCGRPRRGRRGCHMLRLY